MPGQLNPGVYVEEVSSTIFGASTSETAFVDFFADGPFNEARRVESFVEFEEVFGGLHQHSEASYAIRQYFLNGGAVAWVVRLASDHEPESPDWIAHAGAESMLGEFGEGRGMYALEGCGFNILCLPAAANLSANNVKRVYEAAAKFCDAERAFLIIDVPPDIDTREKIIGWVDSANPTAIIRDPNAAIYFPGILIDDPLNAGTPRKVGPSGTLAGVYARTDQQRGVWKAPAGTEASLIGATVVSQMTDAENWLLNPLGINALRTFPDHGPTVWGARTLMGADDLGSEWKYIPVRRLALFIESSLLNGTQWVVFEPNAEPLWAQVRASVGTFLQDLFRAGAFQGSSPRDAYFVKVDGETTTEDDINSGLMNVMVGFAPLRPAEFVVIRIQLIVGRSAP